MHDKGKHPGAVWKKTDFQIHTPRDPQWQGSGPLPGGTEETEAARELWADEFVECCLHKDIDAIAITDHHDIAFYPYIERAIERSAAAKGLLWIFPGVEVTCQDAVQCLMLFDQGTAPDVIRRIFGLMPKVVEPNPNLGRAPQADVCGKDIRQFLEAAMEDTSFRGKSIVLPHASKGGHKDILRKGFHPRFAELEVDGVYNEQQFSKLDASTLSKIYGETPEWGDRRRGILTTGDNRSATFDALAANTSWVRLGEPTAESIRQAVLADQARISYSPPAVPSQRVLELRVCSTLTGPHLELTFNDGFNALIGGRGSGKSALLEYLRFGLGRSTLDTDDDESSERERNLVRSTLIGGYVEVDLERDGVRETWRRTLDRISHISISGTGVPTEVPIAVAQERFRARAFSQKQLSTLVRKAETVDEQITGIAAAEAVDARRETEQRIEAREREVRLAFQSLVQAWASHAAHERDVAKVADLKNRIDATRARLEQGGLNDEQRIVLDQHPVYARTASQFSESLEGIESQLATLHQVKLNDLGSWDEMVDVPPVSAARKALFDANARIQSLIESLGTEFANLRVELILQQESFAELHATFEQTYEVASTAQEHLSSVLSDYQRLTGELERAEAASRVGGDQTKKLHDAEEALRTKREALLDEVTNLRRILNTSSDQVERMSNGTLRARVEEERIPHRRLKALQELCEKCSFRELEQRCASRVLEASGGGGIGWETLLQALLEVRRSLVRAGEGAEIDPELIGRIRLALGWDTTDNQAKAVLGRLDDARMGELLSAWSAPFVRFEYKDRGSFMPFERASPGQQASALLTLLLEQEAGTLIIDQPEDDLDNKVIMKIAKLLQTTKRKRQLIFATHNPNFVVNGDADKVVALTPNIEPDRPEGSEAAQIEIEADGAIETPSVRITITDTMEGGRDAFELRGRKYAF